nr:hypothetical transcript [Hymenolepis microstoma]
MLVTTIVLTFSPTFNIEVFQLLPSILRLIVIVKYYNVYELVKSLLVALKWRQTQSQHENKEKQKLPDQRMKIRILENLDIRNSFLNPVKNNHYAFCGVHNPNMAKMANPMSTQTFRKRGRDADHVAEQMGSRVWRPLD